MATQWQNGICGCFSDIGTCIVTYFCPCVTAGKNAEAVGKSCCVYGFLSMLGCIGIFTQASVRQEIRQRYNIEGGFGSDIICYCCCPLCALVQESSELKAHGGAPGGMAMARS
eukprot:gene3508-4008_t